VNSSGGFWTATAVEFATNFAAFEADIQPHGGFLFGSFKVNSQLEKAPRPMRALLSIVGIVASCWITIASASPIEDDAFSAFEVLCLLPSDPVAELPNTVKRIGFVAMSRDQIDKSFEPGIVDRAWVGKGDARPFIVFLTRSEGCGLASPDASGDAMASLIRNQPSARELRSDVTKVP
jgi:hypothetical protein